MTVIAATALQTARRLAASGEDAEAKQCYLDVLRDDPDNAAALVEIAVLAETSGHRSAASTAYARAIQADPSHSAARTGLADLLTGITTW